LVKKGFNNSLVTKEVISSGRKDDFSLNYEILRTINDPSSVKLRLDEQSFGFYHPKKDVHMYQLSTSRYSGRRKLSDIHYFRFLKYYEKAPSRSIKQIYR